MKMDQPVIRVDGLGKRYRIGGPRDPYGTLRDTIANAARIPFQMMRGERQEPLEFWALKDISFDVHEGEVLGIIGRNGAGKSTLLKILSRVTYPTSGRALVTGRVGSLLDVGTGFHPELTGRENIYLNGAVLGMKRGEIRRKFDEIVEFAETEQFLETPVKRYSSGMYMRLAFAVAAHLEPEILIVDEVLAVGDTAFQQKCLGKMRSVATEGRTVIFVSHNMAAVRTLCTAGLVLDQGRIVGDGTPAQCVELYARSNRQLRDSSWTRPAESEWKPLTITELTSTLQGEQPEMTLDVDIGLETTSPHKPAFLAVDISDGAGTVLMQAVPEPQGFIDDNSRQERLRVSIDLPPLIPGRYFVSVWVGSHHTDTLDEVEEVASFDIVESPTPGRTFPHDWDRGYLVPRSNVRVLGHDG